MTDEKLDQILKQALAPEISDSEIRVRTRRTGNMKKFVKTGKIAAAAAAAAVIGVGGLGQLNPVLAAKLPLIGKIFEQVGEDATYSGDYADKKTVLTNEDPAGNLDTSDYSVYPGGGRRFYTHSAALYRHKCGRQPDSRRILHRRNMEC